MKLTGENRIQAAPQEVWRALNDPEILRQSIPGCESLEKVSDHQFKATVTTRIGPVQAKFTGEVELTDLDPPNGYTISGKGSGGVAGNARGAAKVRLAPDGEGTRLSYDVDAQVTGKLAQLGSRLIDSTAKMLAGQFFNRFEQLVGNAGPSPSTGAASRPAPPHASALASGASAAAAPRPGSQPIPPLLWAVAIAGGVILFAYYFKR